MPSEDQKDGIPPGQPRVEVVGKVKSYDPPGQGCKTYRWWDGAEGASRLRSIEMVLMVGGTDKMACLYAGISVDQLYNYQRNINPEFQARKALLREHPKLVAMQTVVRTLKDDPEMAFKYLERRMPEQFGPRMTVRNEVEEGRASQALEAIAKLISGNDDEPENNGGDEGEAPRAGAGGVQGAEHPGTAGDTPEEPPAVGGPASA